MLELKSINKSFRKKNSIKLLNREQRSVLIDLDLKIDNRDFLVISGKNGSGKTTLLRLIKGLSSPNSGKLSFNNTNQNQVSLVSQNMRSFFFNLTVNENLLFFRDINLTKDKQALYSLMDEFKVSELKDEEMSTLSSGQLKRVSIVRALLNSPEIILFDEVTNSLDDQYTEILLNYLSKLINSKKKIAIIWVTHQVNELSNFEHIHYKIEGGKLLRI